jgi:hypothetical protein
MATYIGHGNVSEFRRCVFGGRDAMMIIKEEPMVCSTGKARPFRDTARCMNEVTSYGDNGCSGKAGKGFRALC